MEKIFMKDSSYDEERFRQIDENIKIIRNNIAQSAEKSGRSEKDIKLMAVTKTVEPRFINYAIDKCGIDLIGENRVQEYFSKKDELHLDKCDVHLIGHLQTNKVKQIVPEVSMIQSVDSLKLAKEIGKQCVSLGINRDILLEINIGQEDSKFGLDQNQITETVCEIAEIEGVFIKGMMTIPPICENLHIAQRFFSKMYSIFIDIGEKKLDNVRMDILSMGMSADYGLAIENGANLVRVGSSMFGARVY